MKKHKKIITSMLITLAGISSLIVNSSKVQAADTIKLSLNHNSYLYDKNGNLIKPKKKILKSQNVIAKGNIEKLSESSNKKYYLIKDYQKYWLPYIVKKNKALYQLSNNSYIRVANVANVGSYNGLYATSGYVTVKKNTFFSNSKGKDTRAKVKKGTRLRVTAYYNLNTNTLQGYRFYQVDDNPNKYIYAYNVTSPRTPLEYHAQGMPDGNTYVVFNKNTNLRNKDGSIRMYAHWGIIPVQLSVDELRYIWIPEENKAELFYRIKDDNKSPQIGGSYIAANAVTFYPHLNGPELEPVNTIKSVTPN